MTVLSLFVSGTPATKGSTRSFLRGGRIVTFNACKKGKSWEQEIRWCALSEWRPRPLLEVPVAVKMVFLIAPPARGKGTPNVGRSDLDKLVRLVGDALTGAVWKDDRQVLEIHALKRYARGDEEEGVAVEVSCV